MFYSKDFGVTWRESTGSFGAGDDASIISNDSGRYVFAVWRDKDPIGDMKIFYSSDFGTTWNDVDSSDTFFGIGKFSSIIADNVAQNIYGLWESSVSFTKGIRSFFPLTLMKDKRL